jgi:hypothetical protein
MAQAAAILIAVGLSWHAARFEPTDPTRMSQSSSTTVSVEIEGGQRMLIRSDGSEVAVLDLTPDEPELGVDDFYMMLNTLESMATNSIVAWQ